MALPLALNLPEFGDEYQGHKMRELAQEIERLHAAYLSDDPDEENVTGYLKNVIEDTTPEFDNDLNIIDGASLYLWDSTNTDNVRMTHTGVNFNTTFTGTTEWNILGLTRVDLNSGADIRIRDALNTSYVDIYHDGTDFRTLAINTSDWDLEGFQDVNYRAGIRHRLYSPDNLKYLQINATDADYTFLASTPLTVRWDAFTTFDIRDGAILRIRDAGDTDYVDLSHSGSTFSYNYTNTVSVVSDGITGEYVFRDGDMRIDSRANSPSQLYLGQGSTKYGDSYDGRIVMYGESGSTSYGFQMSVASGNVGFAGTASGADSAVVTIQSTLNLELNSGKFFRIRDALNTDWADFSHDGTDFNTAFTNTTEWNIGAGLTRVNLEDGVDLRLTENASTDYVEFQVGASFNVVSSGVTAAAFSGFTDYIWLRDGANLRHSDVGDTNYVEWSHTGSEYRLANVSGTTDRLWLRDGIDLRVSNALNTVNGTIGIDPIFGMAFTPSPSGTFASFLDTDLFVIQTQSTVSNPPVSTDAISNQVAAYDSNINPLWRIGYGGGASLFEVGCDVRSSILNVYTMNSTGSFVDFVYADPDAGTGGVFGMVNYDFDCGQTVGAGQDNYVLTYDNTGGLISLEALPGGGSIGGSITDNQIAVGAATADDIEGDANFTWSGTQFLLGVTPSDTQTAPTLAFGDGDTGFYELTDDTLRVSVLGAHKFQWTSTGYYQGSSSGQSWMRAATASATLPTVGPSRSNTTTGLGWDTAGNLVMVCDGDETARFVENAGVLYTRLQGSLFIDARANAHPDLTGYGQYWVGTDDLPKFTDDNGTDQIIDPSLSPINTQNAAYTLVLTDKGKTVHKATSTASITHTIPANSSVAFPIGTLIAWQNDGTVDMTIAITTDTLTGTDGVTGSRTLGASHTAVIQKMTATTWKYAASDL